MEDCLEWALVPFDNYVDKGAKRTVRVRLFEQTSALFHVQTDGETTSQVGFDCNRKISMCMGLLKDAQSAFGCRPIEMDQGGNTVKSA